jgi:hypothetical protein
VKGSNYGIFYGTGKLYIFTKTACTNLEIKTTYFFSAAVFSLLGWSSGCRVFVMTIRYSEQNHW